MRPTAQKLHVQLARQLAGDIVSGRLEPGAPVPSEPQLVAQYEVSKTVVRETLQLLAAAGMLSIQHGKRTVVNPVEEWNILSGIVQEAYRAEGLAGPMVQELYEVRLLLEPEAARWTAERATAKQLRQIDQIVADMDQASDAEDLQVFLDLDRAFHAMIIGRGASNRVLQAILHDIHAVLSTSWAITDLSPDERRTALAHHHTIAAAVLDHDGDAAAAAMREHLLWAAETDRTPARRRTKGRKAAGASR